MSEYKSFCRREIEQEKRECGEGEREISRDCQSPDSTVSKESCFSPHLSEKLGNPKAIKLAFFPSSFPYLAFPIIFLGDVVHFLRAERD